VGERIQLGARLKGLSVLGSESSIVATYELINPKNVPVGGGGSVRIEFAALDAIDKQLGGTGCPSDEQRIDLAAKFLRPLIVGNFERVEPSTEREDVTIHAHGVVASARPSGPPEGA